MAIVTVGIDLAKNVFAVHGVGEAGKPELVRPEVPRAKLLEFVAHLPPCLFVHRVRQGYVEQRTGMINTSKTFPAGAIPWRATP